MFFYINSKIRGRAFFRIFGGMNFILILKENEEMEYLLPVACRSISNCNFKNIVYGRSETR